MFLCLSQVKRWDWTRTRLQVQKVLVPCAYGKYEKNSLGFCSNSSTLTWTRWRIMCFGKRSAFQNTDRNTTRDVTFTIPFHSVHLKHPAQVSHVICRNTLMTVHLYQRGASSQVQRMCALLCAIVWEHSSHLPHQQSKEDDCIIQKNNFLIRYFW